MKSTIDIFLSFIFSPFYININNKVSEKLIICILFVAGVVLAYDASAYDPFRSIKGSSVTSGSHYSRQDAYSAINTVSTEDVSGEDWSATVALPYNVHGNYSFADVADVSDRIKVIIEDIDNVSNLSGIQSLQSKVQGILVDFSNFGSVISGNLITNGLLPVIAVSHPAIDGTFTFEYQGNLQSLPAGFSAGFTSAEININPQECIDLVNSFSIANFDKCQAVLNDEQLRQLCGTSSTPNGFEDCPRLQPNPEIFELQSDSSINFRSVSSFDNLIFGYSREVWGRIDKKNSWATGRLHAGGRISYSSFKTRILNQRLTDLQNKEFNDLLEEVTSDKNTKESGGLGLDLAANWQSQRYSVGFTLYDVVAPEIEFTTGKSIKSSMAPSLDAKYFINEAKSFVVRLQNDFSESTDLSGTKNQWRVLGIGYVNSDWYIPGVELSKRWNLSGFKLAYTALGLSLFNAFNINAALADQKISGVPRSLLFSAGFGWDI